MNLSVRITDYCNLNCDYCYATSDDPQSMSIKTLEIVLKALADHSEGEVTINWTGGEPLLQGIKFFQKIIELQNEIEHITFNNVVQTNLTLINDEFITFFTDNDFQVRTSLDLPPQNHDSLRTENNFIKTLERIHVLQDRGARINVNTVVTNRNIHQAKEIYDFLKENNIPSFSVSRFVVQGNGEQNTDLMIKERGQFGRFLIELYDFWTEDKDTCLERITPLDNILNACKAHMRKEPESARKCFHCQDQIFAISPLGMVFPSCNKFLAHPSTCFGVLGKYSLDDIFNSDKRKAFLDKVEASTNKQCPECKYNDICQGGCFFLAYAAGIEEYKDREDYCKGYYFVFDHIVTHLERETCKLQS